MDVDGVAQVPGRVSVDANPLACSFGYRNSPVRFPLISLIFLILGQLLKTKRREAKCLLAPLIGTNWNLPATETPPSIEGSDRWFWEFQLCQNDEKIASNCSGLLKFAIVDEFPFPELRITEIASRIAVGPHVEAVRVCDPRPTTFHGRKLRDIARLVSVLTQHIVGGEVMAEIQRPGRMQSSTLIKAALTVYYKLLEESVIFSNLNPRFILHKDGKWLIVNYADAAFDQDIAKWIASKQFVQVAKESLRAAERIIRRLTIGIEEQDEPPNAVWLAMPPEQCTRDYLECIRAAEEWFREAFGVVTFIRPGNLGPAAEGAIDKSLVAWKRYQDREDALEIDGKGVDHVYASENEVPPHLKEYTTKPLVPAATVPLKTVKDKPVQDPEISRVQNALFNCSAYIRDNQRVLGQRIFCLCYFSLCYFLFMLMIQVITINV